MADDLAGRVDEPLQRPIPSGVSPRATLQESIHRSLRELNPDLADLYEGARRILEDERSLPGWGILVPHAVREISVRVPDLVLAGAVARGRDAAALMEAITQVWKKHGLSMESPEVPLKGDPSKGKVLSVEIPSPVAGVIGEAVREHSNREGMRGKLRAAVRERTGRNGGSLDRLVNEWKRSHDWADKHRHAYLTPRVASLDEYRSEFRGFELTLAGLLVDFVTNMEEIDAILAEANSRTG